MQYAIIWNGDVPGLETKMLLRLLHGFLFHSGVWPAAETEKMNSVLLITIKVCFSCGQTFSICRNSYQPKRCTRVVAGWIWIVSLFPFILLKTNLNWPDTPECEQKCVVQMIRLNCSGHVQQTHFPTSTAQMFVSRFTMHKPAHHMEKFFIIVDERSIIQTNTRKWIKLLQLCIHTVCLQVLYHFSVLDTEVQCRTG